MGCQQFRNGPIGLIPDVGCRSDGVLQHVFVLFQLGLVLLDLLSDGSYVLDRADSGLANVQSIDYWNAGNRLL
ncbi:hypothetical protein D3C81_1814700 [compost metagenome]